MKTEIEQRQCDRFSVLYEAYKDSKADMNAVVKIADLAATKGIKNGVFKEAVNYLKEEGFLGKQGSQTATITHEGVKIVEYVVTHPEDATDLFPAFKDMGI